MARPLFGFCGAVPLCCGCVGARIARPVVTGHGFLSFRGGRSPTKESVSGGADYRGGFAASQ